MGLRQWSWVSNEFSLIVMGAAPVICPWIKEVSYEDALETELVRGAGRDPQGTTDPAYVPGDGSMSVFAREWRLFLKLITGNGLLKVGDLDFALSVKRSLRTLPIPEVDRIDFVVKSNADSNAAGNAETLFTTVAFQVTAATRGGVSL